MCDSSGKRRPVNDRLKDRTVKIMHDFIKNLEYRKSLERKKSRSKRTKSKMLQMLKSRVKRKKK